MTNITDTSMQDRLDRLYFALEVCSAELFAQCADQGRAMKYVEQARSALAAEQCARAAAHNAPLYDPREVAFSAQAAPMDYPAGAIVNGRTLIDRLENYSFECEAGTLLFCSDWHELKRCFEHLAATPSAAESREELACRLIGEVKTADDIATAICHRVAELGGRGSPEDWPKAMLVTGDELHLIAREAVIEAQEAPAAAAPVVLPEPIAQTEDEGTLLDYAMAIAHERELNVLGHHHDSDGAVLRFRSAVRRALRATGGQAQAMDIAELVTGMSVSVDVSTGDDDAGNRYFGTVTVIQEDLNDKHGLTLLVQDAEPNFTPQEPADARDAARYRWLRDPCSGAECVIFYSRGDYGKGLMSGTMLDEAIDVAQAKHQLGDIDVADMAQAVDF